VFHVGASAGFFSEYNCMILAMLYCLKNKIRFVLYSKDANFGYKDGWNDFFESFCESTTCFIHHRFNVRWFTTRTGQNQWRPKGTFMQIFTKFIKLFIPPSRYFTQDLWHNFVNRNMLEQEYDIPELGIKGNFLHACIRLVELTWRYNASTKAEIEKIMKRCPLPDKYVSCHIRRGDKITEWDYIPLEKYIAYIEQYKISDIYILTDDYTVYETLQEEKPEWNIYTLCNKSDRGYEHSNFGRNNAEEKRKRILALFASIEIMNKSALFVGTKTANPSVFMSIYNPKISKGIDCDGNLFVEAIKSL
jgi:hypothetical protein